MFDEIFLSPQVKRIVINSNQQVVNVNRQVVKNN